MEDVWIMDSGCSRHMTGHRKWFSSLNPVSTKEYITFGDNGQGKVLGVGSVSLSANLYPREVAFVRNLVFNLVSVSQLLDAEETLVCSLLPFGQVEFNGPNPRIAHVESWEGLSDEDINYNTSTSTPQAQASSPTLGPITRARARELNYIMLLKNEGPEE
ncbi:hypothetical protein U9M48_043187 [Paspalum notatum var. saurae]|uniref:Retrovirus-related Pol polyprotein from transposon TNT 1-94-like beta-barrel domain-containing protein n=1 Tax=Paspalum notatum var. saurae TaxID=547442 RepID=A0AAQ3UUG9_PASNO